MFRATSLFFPSLASAAVTFALLTGLPRALGGAERTHPNVILVLSDDLGYADISPYGQKQIQTPHLEGMAREGMRFTDAYAGAPVCGPSRATLFLGLHTGHNPIRQNPGQA